MISTHTNKKKFIKSIADSFVEEGIAMGIQKGKEEGKKEGKLELVKILLSNGVDPEFIFKNTGIDLAIIKKIQTKKIKTVTH